MTQGPEVTAAATFCATLVDEWARAGVRHAIVCPGSRSTPMALALAADGRLDVQVVHDERSAAFIALGIGLSTQVPAVVLTTSGTAAAQLHPAVVEAGLSSVPMIVCTADRPPELQDVGAPQTVDQVHLYGHSVRWFAAPEVPDERRGAAFRCAAVAARPGGLAEEGAQHRSRLGLVDAADDFRAHGEAPVAEHVVHRSGSARLFVPRTEDDAADARLQDRSGAHEARLESDDERAALEIP